MAGDAMEVISSPTIQYGFAGLCMVLLGIIVWLIKQLLLVLKENNKIIGKNTEAVTQLIGANKEAKQESENLKTSVYSMRDKLMQQPCMRDVKS